MPRTLPVLGCSALALCAALAHASEPAGNAPKDAAEAFRQSRTVFLGSVEKVEKDGLGFDSRAHVRVGRVWKGGELLQTKRAVVDGSGGPTYPARVFQAGETYLFYVNPQDASTSGDLTFRADSVLQRVLTFQEAIAQDEFQVLQELAVQHWKTCQLDRECTTVPGPCGEPMAISKAFQDEVNGYVAIWRTEVKCVSPRGKPPAASAACVQGQCQVAGAPVQP